MPEAPFWGSPSGVCGCVCRGYSRLPHPYTYSLNCLSLGCEQRTLSSGCDPFLPKQGQPGKRPHLTFRGRASGPTLIPRPSFLALESFARAQDSGQLRSQTVTLSYGFKQRCSPPWGTLLSPFCAGVHVARVSTAGTDSSWPPSSRWQRWSRLCKELPGPRASQEAPQHLCPLEHSCQDSPPVRPRVGGAQGLIVWGLVYVSAPTYTVVWQTASPLWASFSTAVK